MSAPSRIRPVTRGDAPEIVDLLNACDVAETGAPDSTLEDLQNDWSMDGFDPARDAWVAEGSAGLVGYAYAGDQFRTGELEADLWVHPGHHEPELGGRLLGLAERRAAQLAVERGYPDPTLDVFCIAANRVKRDLLRKHGYALKRTVYRMSIDLNGGAPELPVPEGLEIRPFRLEADERTLYEAMNEAFVDHFRQSEEPFDAWRARLLGHADLTRASGCCPGTARSSPAPSSPTTTATSGGSRGSACAARGAAAASGARSSRPPSPSSRGGASSVWTLAWTRRARPPP